jgi:hypothetical protein
MGLGDTSDTKLDILWLPHDSDGIEAALALRDG